MIPISEFNDIPFIHQIYPDYDEITRLKSLFAHQFPNKTIILFLGIESSSSIRFQEFSEHLILPHFDL